jgi:hypothetical protein
MGFFTSDRGNLNILTLEHIKESMSNATDDFGTFSDAIDMFISARGNFSIARQSASRRQSYATDNAYIFTDEIDIFPRPGAT